MDGVLQDFSGSSYSASSYNAVNMYEGFGTYGYNFVSLKVVDGECKLERLGRA